MSSFFFHVLIQPFTNLLVWFYNTIAFQDLGLAIIFLTIFIRLLLFPLFHKSTRQQLILQRLQPRFKEIQRDLKHDKVKQTEAMMALYAEHGINPFSGFLFLIIQIPILIALYRIFLTGLTSERLSGLYSFVANPGEVHNTFLGLINLDSRSMLMVVLAAALQYIQAKLMLPKKDATKSLSPLESASRNMVVIGPLMTLLIFYNLPAAVSLYWVVSSILSIIQQIIVNRDLAHLKDQKASSQ